MIDILEDGSMTIEDGADIDALCAFVMDAVGGKFMKELMPLVTKRVLQDRGEEAVHELLINLQAVQSAAIDTLETGPVVGPFDYGLV